MSTRTLVAVTSTGQVSGAERVLVRVLAAAREAGWSVTCAAPAGVLADELAAVGVNHLELPELGLGGGSRTRAAAGLARRWTRAARQVRRAGRGADLVLVNALTALPVVRLASLVGRRTPTVWLAHDVVVREDRLRLYRACAPALNRVVGVSEAVVERLPGTVPTSVVHNGVLWPVEPARPATGPAVVGINALLTPWKGHRVLLDAVPLLPPDVRVEIMGGALTSDVDHAADLRARAAGPAVGGRVEVLGHVADPLERMRSWTVAVSASTDPEACPLNVLEAMSLGLPVVATDHGGSPEVLDGAGLLVPPADAPALAAAVVRLLEDADLRDRCSRDGRDRVAAGHRVDHQTRVLLDLLDHEADETTGRRRR